MMKAKQLFWDYAVLNEEVARARRTPVLLSYAAKTRGDARANP